MSAQQVLRDDSSVGQWVAQHPQTAKVFDMLQIDYCCDSDKPLETACWENGLEVLRVHTLLRHTVAEAADAAKVDWTKASLSELCDHIEHTHHTLLKETLPLLSDMVAEVAELHGSEHEELRDVQQNFIVWRDEIIAVMAEEERSLFPAIRELESSDRPKSDAADSVHRMIRRLALEHADIGEALKSARAASNRFKAPKDACPKFAQMYGLLRWIEADVRQHVHKEEAILFPRVNTLVGV